MLEYLIPNPWALISCYKPLCFLGKILKPGWRDLLPLRHKNISEVGDWGRAQRSISNKRCWMGLKSGLCARQSCSSTLNSENYFFMDLVSCTWEVSCCGEASKFPLIVTNDYLHYWLIVWSVKCQINWGNCPLKYPRVHPRCVQMSCFVQNIQFTFIFEKTQWQSAWAEDGLSAKTKQRGSIYKHKREKCSKSSPGTNK